MNPIVATVLELSDQFAVDPALIIETAQDEPSVKSAILSYSKGEMHLDDLTYIFNQVF